MSTRVIFMDKGRIVEEGLPRAFFEAPTSERAKKFLAQLSSHR